MGRIGSLHTGVRGAPLEEASSDLPGSGEVRIGTPGKREDSLCHDGVREPGAAIQKDRASGIPGFTPGNSIVTQFRRPARLLKKYRLKRYPSVPVRPASGALGWPGGQESLTLSLESSGLEVEWQGARRGCDGDLTSPTTFDPLLPPRRTLSESVDRGERPTGPITRRFREGVVRIFDAALLVLDSLGAFRSSLRSRSGITVTSLRETHETWKTRDRKVKAKNRHRYFLESATIISREPSIANQNRKISFAFRRFDVQRHVT